MGPYPSLIRDCSWNMLFRCIRKKYDQWRHCVERDFSSVLPSTGMWAFSPRRTPIPPNTSSTTNPKAIRWSSPLSSTRPNSEASQAPPLSGSATSTPTQNDVYPIIYHLSFAQYCFYFQPNLVNSPVEY